MLAQAVTHAVRYSKQDNAGALITSSTTSLVVLEPALYYAAEHTYIRQAAKLLYLVNPLLILSTAAGCTASLTNLSVITALYGGLSGNTALAGMGLAAGFYLSAHPALLLVCLIDEIAQLGIDCSISA